MRRGFSMYTTIQNNKNPAQELNGRYYQTFTAQSAQELIKIHHLGCIGNTEVTNIQLEKGRSPTNFVVAKETTSPLSGLFKDFRNLKVDLSNEDSSLRASFQNSAKSQMVQYFNTNVRSEIQQSANQIRQTVSSLVDGAVMKSDIQITPTGIQLGTGKYVNGETISSMLVANPESIKAITKLMEVSGNLLVNGSITADKMAANSITAALLKAASVESKHIVSEAVEAKHLKVDEALLNKLLADEAFINKLTAKQAFINYLSTVKLEASQIKADDAFIKKLTSAKAFIDVLDSRKITAKQISTNLLSAYTGFIGGFKIGEHEIWGGHWITGYNSYSVGMSNGERGGSQGVALFVNWGKNWSTPGPNSWYVAESGSMNCNGSVYLKGQTSVTNGMYFESGGQLFYNGTELTQHIKTTVSGLTFSSLETTNDIRVGKDLVVGGWIYYQGGYIGKHALENGSDIRFKKNIVPTSIYALDRINKLKTYEYDFAKDNNKYHKELGLIAQEVEQWIPDAHLVERDDLQSYSPFFFIPYLVKAIQELDEKITILEGKLKNGK